MKSQRGEGVGSAMTMTKEKTMRGLIDLADVPPATPEQRSKWMQYEEEKEKLRNAPISDREYYKRLKEIAERLGI